MSKLYDTLRDNGTVNLNPYPVVHFTVLWTFVMIKYGYNDAQCAEIHGESLLILYYMHRKLV